MKKDKRESSTYKGVMKKGKKWRATLYASKMIVLPDGRRCVQKGGFKTELEAAQQVEHWMVKYAR